MSEQIMGGRVWTPEQRVAVARVAILRLKGLAEPSTAGRDTGTVPAASLERVVAGNLSESNV